MLLVQYTDVSVSGRVINVYRIIFITEIRRVIRLFLFSCRECYFSRSFVSFGLRK